MQLNVPAGLNDAIAISAGQYHNLPLRANGTVVAWGENGDGQGSVPPGLSNVVAISAGYMHNLALKKDGTVVAWGNNWYGQGVAPADLTNVTAISAGYLHNIVLRSNGVAVAWGWDGGGNGQTTVPNNSNIVGVAAGGLLTMILKNNGTTVAEISRRQNKKITGVVRRWVDLVGPSFVNRRRQKHYGGPESTYPLTRQRCLFRSIYKSSTRQVAVSEPSGLCPPIFRKVWSCRDGSTGAYGGQ